MSNVAHLKHTTMVKIANIRKGASICKVEDLCFPVSIGRNPRNTNREYSMVVTGIINGFKLAVETEEEAEEVEVEVVNEVENNEEVEVDLNYCSPRYALIPNSSIFPNIEKVLRDNNIEFEVEYKHINHVRFYARYRITDKRFAYVMKGTSDVIEPCITVQHSYNGLTVYKIVFGYFRLVCTNGLTIPVAEMKKFNLVIVGKHTETILKSFDMLDEKLKFFAANADIIKEEISAQYERLASRWNDKPADRVKEVLEATGIATIDNKKFNTVNDIMSRIKVESEKEGFGYNGKVNDWLIYNGINQYMNDDNRNIYTPEKRMEIDSKLLEYMLYF